MVCRGNLPSSCIQEIGPTRNEFSSEVDKAVAVDTSRKGNRLRGGMIAVCKFISICNSFLLL